MTHEIKLEKRMLAYTPLEVAAISMKPKKWDKEANALKMEKLFQEAAEGGTKVAVITEGALEGYVVYDVFKRPELANRLFEVAEPSMECLSGDLGNWLKISGSA